MKVTVTTARPVPTPPQAEVTITMSEAQAQVVFELLGDMHDARGVVSDLYEALEAQGFKHESLEEAFAGYFEIIGRHLTRTTKGDA